MNFLKSILFTVLLLAFANYSSAQDWPNLKKFENQNASLKPPKQGEDRVVFMGNSITIGWLKSRPAFFENKPYVNRGISGQTTPQMLVRFRQDVVALSPSVVVILAGINDIAGNTGPSTVEMIVDNIISMTEIAKANNIKVVICSVLPAIDFPWRKGMKPANEVIKLNKLLKAYAESNDLVYADYFSATVNSSNGLKEELGSDGVHPNAKGYAIMEPIVEEAIKKALQ